MRDAMVVMFKGMNELRLENERLTQNRDLWRKTAEELARQLGKVEYAIAEYQTQAVRGE